MRAAEPVWTLRRRMHVYVPAKNSDLDCSVVQPMFQLGVGLFCHGSSADLGNNVPVRTKALLQDHWRFYAEMLRSGYAASGTSFISKQIFSVLDDKLKNVNNDVLSKKHILHLRYICTYPTRIVIAITFLRLYIVIISKNIFPFVLCCCGTCFLFQKNYI
jgi:hypothetical protein